MPKPSLKAHSVIVPFSYSGVVAVDKALGILRLFSPQQPALSLAKIAELTGLYKSTILRLLESLEYAQLLFKKPDGQYILGPSIVRLYQSYQASNTFEFIALAALRELTEITQESSAIHIRQGEHRLCLLRVNSSQALQDQIKVGDLLPMHQGAGGKVIQAFEGRKGKLFDQIRKAGVLALPSDRIQEISGISAPVFNDSGLLGALTLTMPTYRYHLKHTQIVKETAEKVSKLLSSQPT